MSPRRRVTSAALALAAAMAFAACTEADNGNNTLAYTDTDTPPSASATAPGAPQSTAPAVAGKDIELEAKDNEFVPLQITAKAGSITIVMKNTGKAPHTFTQSQLGVDVNADAGQTAKIEIKDAKPGTYHFICKYHEVLKMVGDLTVT